MMWTGTSCRVGTVSQLFAGGFPGAGHHLHEPVVQREPGGVPGTGELPDAQWLHPLERVRRGCRDTLPSAQNLQRGARRRLGLDAPRRRASAYTDVISLGRATWVDRGDTAGRGFAMGCGVLTDHGDNRPQDGDCDHDHDFDNRTIAIGTAIVTSAGETTNPKPTSTEAPVPAFLPAPAPRLPGSRFRVHGSQEPAP